MENRLLLTNNSYSYNSSSTYQKKTKQYYNNVDTAATTMTTTATTTFNSQNIKNYNSQTLNHQNNNNNNNNNIKNRFNLSNQKNRNNNYSKFYTNNNSNSNKINSNNANNSNSKFNYRNHSKFYYKTNNNYKFRNRHNHNRLLFNNTSLLTKTKLLSSGSFRLTSSNNQIDYSNLPNVVLTKIYSYLNLNDRLNASLTCKNWRLGLFNPSLWSHSNMTIYLLNRFIDLKSSDFKSTNLAKYVRKLDLKYDPNDLNLVECLNRILFNLNSQNLKCLSLQPILVDYYDDYDYFYQSNQIKQVKNSNKLDENDSFKQNKNLFINLTKLCSNLKSIEHLSLGLLDDLDNEKRNLNDLIECLNRKHQFNLKSLHLSTCKMNGSNLLTNTNNMNCLLMKMSNFVIKYVNLTHLSIDYEHLSDELLSSSVGMKSLKKLNLNVNRINNLINQENRIKDESWLIVKNSNSSLRVVVNFLVVEEAIRKYNLILSPWMPLETLRMYFCKSLNPDILQFISNNYSETLQNLTIVDVITDPSLRYHNPLRHDADPDPLVLLCWKCKYLKELVLIGYEILEINLIAIAKLRTNLKTFCVPMDCVIDLRYGQFNNDDFIEDEDGEDTIVDYGFCSDQVINKVSRILKCDNWHPLEKDELPLCVYDFDIPYEEAYLEAIINDQFYD